METISLRDVSRDSKIALLKELGYDSDGQFVLKDGQRVLDDSINEYVTLDNMAVLPGSTVVIVDDPVSLASYFERHGDWD